VATPQKQCRTAHNLILVGGTGTGKTHLATALGVAAIQGNCVSCSLLISSNL